MYEKAFIAYQPTNVCLRGDGGDLNLSRYELSAGVITRLFLVPIACSST